MVTVKQILLVQGSWARVKDNADQVAMLFYNRLFEIAPQVKPLFSSNIEEQGRKLMSMLTVAVNGLPKLDLLIPSIENMGRRHHEYGVKDEDYDTVGEALLWTLEQGLGDHFTDEVRAAWTETYVTLAGVMKAASTTACV